MHPLWTTLPLCGTEGCRARRDDGVRRSKLLGFAVGREVQLSAEPLLEEMADRLARNDYRSRWQWSWLFSASSFAWSAEVKTLRSMARQATIRSITTGLGLLCPAYDGGEQTEVVGDGPRILKWKNGPPRDEGNHSGEQGMDVQAVSSRNALLVTYPHRYAGLTGSCRDRDTLGPLLRFRWTCGLFPATHDHRSNAILILRRAESIERVNHLAGVLMC